jgi:hypothetical protein
MKKIKKKKKLHEKTNFDPLSNPDSMYSRLTADRKSKAGENIQQMLDLDDEGPGGLKQHEPLKMMDLVLQNWEGDAEKKGKPFATDEDPEEDSDEDFSIDPEQEDDED